MLADILKNRLFIGALAIFIFCVGGSLLYMQHVQRVEAEKFAETEDHVRQWKEGQNADAAAKTPVGDTSQGGHYHGDEWHAEPHETPQPSQSDAGETAALSDEDLSDVTPEQRAQIEKMRAQQLADYIAKWGEPPSPDGSYQHYRDNHGNVHRHYQGTVAIRGYDFITRFAPTPEELERYKQLRADLKAATSADEKNGGTLENPSLEVQRLDTALKSLVANAQREIPFPSGFGYWGGSNSGFLSPAEEKRLDAIALREFYQRFGMEHLYELHEESTKFYQKY